jgi:molybdopterin converting factor small subunit
MIHVELHMHGNLRRLLPQGVGSVHLELADGAVVRDLIGQLGAQDEVWIAAIGNQAVPLETRLVDGVSVDFFPHLEGG